MGRSALTSTTPHEHAAHDTHAYTLPHRIRVTHPSVSGGTALLAEAPVRVLTLPTSVRTNVALATNRGVSTHAQEAMYPSE